jgi:hypothetical protein
MASAQEEAIADALAKKKAAELGNSVGTKINTTATNVNGGGSYYDFPTINFDPNEVTTDPDEHDYDIDASEEENIRRKYPTFAHWLDHPEIGPILRESVKEGWDEYTLAAAIEPTDWYQTTEASEREFAQQSVRDPATLQRQIDQQRVMLDSVAKTQGIQMSEDDIDELATNVIKHGLSESEILRQLSGFQREQTGDQTDGLLAIQQKLRSMAQAYQLKYDDKTLAEYATRIFEGTATQDSMKATFQQQAAQFYPHLADQLEKGLTVEDYFQPIKARVASILEMNPADIDMSQGKFASLGQFVDDKGNMRAPTYTEIDQFARDQDEFGYTKQGITSGYEKMNSMARTLGIMK